MSLTSISKSVVLLTLATQGYSQNAYSNAEAAFDVLNTWYNQGTGLWDTTGWWNSANAMTAVADLALLDGNRNSQATSIFSNTFTQAQVADSSSVAKYIDSRFLMQTVPPNAGAGSSNSLGSKALNARGFSGFLNDYYDDEGWWALAWIQAYDLTQNQDYLNMAASIFNDMTGGWTTPCGGGIWWDKPHTQVNAIANELFLSVAAHLANRVSSDQKQGYVDWATKEWSWFQGTGMINSNSTINDGLDISTCQNNGGTVWSYNQGVILGGLIELNKAAPDASYIPQAQAIASAAITALSDGNGVLHDSCEPDCGADGTQFKGIFMRNLQYLQATAGQDQYKTSITNSANSIWANDNSNNQLSVNWAGPFIAPANASTQSSALDALVAAISVQ